MNPFLTISGMGRLAREPETRTVGQHNSKLASASIAINLRVKGTDGQWKDAAQFYTVNMWGAKSEELMKLKKGASVYFSGELQCEEWLDKTTNQIKTGQKLDLTKIVSLDPRPTHAANGAAPAARAAFPQRTAAPEPASGFPKAGEPPDAEDDVPF